MPARILAILLFFLSFHSACYCAPWIIATFPTTPFVFVDGNSSVSGFSIDLWDAIAENQDIEYKFIIVKSLIDLLNAVTNGSTIANASICSISITPERLGIMDFSQPMLDSGLQILAYKSTKSEDANRTVLILKVLFSRLFWEILGVFFIFVIVFTHLFYLLEKRPKGTDAAVRASYMRGGFEDSVWWASSVLFTSGSDLMPMTALGRLLTFVGFLASCVLVCILQAAITAQLTVSSLQQSNGISNINDLYGLKVGVENGSTSDIFLSNYNGIYVVRYSSSAAMLDAFSKRADGLSACLEDFPVLQYYVATEGANIGTVVGPIYQPQQYGIAFPSGSSLRRQVDVGILSLQEQGKFQPIVDKWFSGIADSDEDINVLDPTDLTLEITWGVVAFSAIFVIVIMSVRYAKAQQKLKQPRDVPLDPVHPWDAVEQEITNLQDNLQELSDRLHKVKEMALRAKKKEGSYY